MDRILSGVFPDSANNNYEGSQMVILIFGALNIISVFRSLIHILKEDGGAQSIATIPLDRYTKPAADTIVFLFAYWGLSQLLMALMYISGAHDPPPDTNRDKQWNRPPYEVSNNPDRVIFVYDCCFTIGC